MQAQFLFSQQECKQYGNCPDINYQGGHLGGLSSCVYCAEIFRRYRIRNGEQLTISSQQAEDNLLEVNEKQVVRETQKLSLKVGADGDQQCGKLVCMKAGFCTCE